MAHAVTVGPGLRYRVKRENEGTPAEAGAPARIITSILGQRILVTLLIRDADALYTRSMDETQLAAPESPLIALAVEIAEAESLPPAAVERIAQILRQRGVAADPWLKVTEVAAAYRVSTEAVVRMCQRGEFPRARNTGTALRQDWRVPAGDLTRAGLAAGPNRRPPRRSRYRPQFLVLPAHAE